jgi:diguanylate cyclase (GGDEF)-like protein
MLRKSFKSKIIFPAIVILVLLTVTLATYMFVRFSLFSDFLIHEKVVANASTLRLFIDRGHSRAAAVSMAHNPAVINAVKNHDRDELLRIFAPVYDIYQVSFCTVTDDKGIVLVRTHDPEKFGDSLAHLQSIKNALNGEVSSYCEAGTVVKISVRTGAPVYDTDGTLVGVVSIGVRFDSHETVDELKELLHAEVTILLGDAGIVTTLHSDGQRTPEAAIDPKITKMLMESKQEYFGDVNILGTVYKTFCMPLLNTDNEMFAAIFIASPMTELIEEMNALIRNVIVISFIVMIAAILLLYRIISSISEPLIVLSKEMDKIEAGNLDVVIETKSDDEVGHVGKTFQKVADILRKLIEGINTAIAEYAKGNMDYILDVTGFQGDYRLLADRIVELSNLGMKDKLTGIPNRRTFDNRLTLEWERARRERIPLSLLIIDVDHFKNYNDTYGHQQGDVVLREVARGLSQPVRRTIDFVARWGGEEFVVLLPHTDSKGALHIAELIRKTVENLEIPRIDGGTAEKVTISIGVNTLIPSRDNSIENLISKTDEALYRAKETGRNRVCRYEGGE